MKKYKIGYIQGEYDMFHIKHLNLINEAKIYCDYLVVGVDSDDLVRQIKGKNPVILQGDRCRIVDSIRAVDKVIIVDTFDVYEVLSKIPFDILFIEDDQKENPRFLDAKNKLLLQGIEIIYLSNNLFIYDKYLHKEKTLLNKIDRRGIVGYTTGTFDMFHVGHLNILMRSKELCDYLIVGVSTDELVLDYKHHLPVISFNERMEIIRNVSYVDEVVPQTNRDKMAAYEQYKFDLMFVGNDWKGDILFEEVEKKLIEQGSKVIYFDYTQGISSSLLREKIKE